MQYTEKVVIFGKCGNGIKPESLDVLATNTCWGSVVLRSRDGASPLPFSDCKKYDGISLFKLKIHRVYFAGGGLLFEISLSCGRWDNFI